MKKIGFIGAYDKTDFILYVAKILVEMGKKVILIDGTLTQKAKYIIPVIKPSKSYVTEFEGIDIAVGFENFNNIKVMIKTVFSIIMKKLREDTSLIFLLGELGKVYKVVS